MKPHVLPFIFSIFFVMTLSGCALFAPFLDKQAESDIVQLRLEISSITPPIENPEAFLSALQKSCAPILKKSSNQSYGPKIDGPGFGGTVADWQTPCRAVMNGGMNAENILKTYFQAYKVYDGSDDEGLFTGYYEPLLKGSYDKTDRYNTPLYARPESLVEVNLGAFSEDLKGKRIAGKIDGRRLVPFADRTEIDNGALNDQADVLVWVDSAIDAFFLHIQGSGVIEFTDGTRTRIGYAAQNGHSYYAIGRALIDRGEISKEAMSLQAIRTWLADNPNQARDLMQLNPSYVFFRWLDEGLDGPLGAQGIALTPEVSLAVDRKRIPYGAPIWLEAEDPLDIKTDLKQMMVAQDTGGAIRGAVRGDVFWGAGADAALKAGQMKSRGKYWVFLPKTIVIDPQYFAAPSDKPSFFQFRD